MKLNAAQMLGGFDLKHYVNKSGKALEVEVTATDVSYDKFDFGLKERKK